MPTIPRCCIPNDQPRDFVGYGPKPAHMTWPGGVKLAINLVLNYEEGSEYSLAGGRPQRQLGRIQHPRQPAGARPRHRDAFRIWQPRRGLAAGPALRPLRDSGHGFACAVALERNPAVVEWMNARGHDLLGHGLRWTRILTIERATRSASLHEAIALYQKLTGKRPLGWNCRSFPSVNTRDLLVARRRLPLSLRPLQRRPALFPRSRRRRAFSSCPIPRR